MKKSGILLGMALAGMVGIGTYTLMNKKTKNKADELINTMLDKANDMANNMSK